MTRILAFIAALALAGCGVPGNPVSAKIDAVTGTTQAQRCVGYRAALIPLDVREKQGNLSRGEADWLEIYRALVASCPPVTPA